MRYRPVTPDRLVGECVAAVAARPGRVVVAVDGADAAHPRTVAVAITEHLRTAGRASDVVDAHDWLRPASTRMEWGRTDAESFRSAWFDHAAIGREVVDALRDRGEWLPRLWDPVRDRSFRDRPRAAAPDQVLVLAGPLLLGSGLSFDLTVALRMSEGALRRHTPDDDQWTIAPLLGHADDAGAAGAADLEVRYDHPDRPAVRAD